MDKKYRIVPVLDFVQRYLKIHKEWSDIVAPNMEKFIHKH